MIWAVEPLPAAAIALVLAALVASSPLVAMPIGLLLATYMLATGAPIWLAAVAGAGGATVARALMALQARTGRTRDASPDAKAQQDQFSRWLRDSPSYRQATFIAAALPVFPARFLFPILGSIRAPLDFALAGAFVGQIPLQALSTACFAGVARWATGSDTAASWLLGAIAIGLIVRKLAASIDWQHWRDHRSLRFRDDAFESNVPGMVRMSLLGDQSPVNWVPPGRPDAAGDTIEGEVIDQEWPEADDQLSPGPAEDSGGAGGDDGDDDDADGS
jgi:hypothetical protein